VTNIGRNRGVYIASNVGMYTGGYIAANIGGIRGDFEASNIIRNTRSLYPEMYGRRRPYSN
jgi:hypothetical protein